jgi:tetrahydromethanopterin S-methyltransferase subunit E
MCVRAITVCGVSSIILRHYRTALPSSSSSSNKIKNEKCLHRSQMENHKFCAHFGAASTIMHLLVKFPSWDTYISCSQFTRDLQSSMCRFALQFA